MLRNVTITRVGRPSRPSTLGYFLDRLHQDYNDPKYLASDPLEFVHRYRDGWDQEAVALVSALLAYGNVKQIRRSVAGLLTRMESCSSTPRDFVRALRDPVRAPEARAALEGFVHRFNRGRDLGTLLELLGRSWEEHGSLGAHFLSHLDPAAPDISGALDALNADWLGWAGKKARGSFLYLLTAPRDGSCCKRWCMFLRWMGRQDSLDPGLWTAASPLSRTFPGGRFLRASQLVIPLDTHTGRISQYLGLTRRKSLGWRAAVEVTTSLRTYDSADPTRYDFALSRLGILDLCQRKYRAEICERCQLRPHCRFAAKGARKALKGAA
ncbi:MAG TPA: TIGR02757 family protein [Bdellovibrionota bacterium]|nr:TIGR02757 family protein [Bdellovibrionota bacterium]